MLTNFMTRVTLAAFLGIGTLGGTACTADIHDNVINIDDPTVTFETSVDVDDVQPGESVPVEINAENVYLIAPDETPPSDHVEDAGHLRFYFDDLDSSPLLITASASVSLSIPAEATEGPHKIHCRVHKHDGTATSATFSIDITVVVTVGT